MKKLILGAVVSISLVNASGIPVVDAVANAQAMAQNIKTVAEWAKEAERWANTVTHYQSQLDAYKNQLLSQTQIRDSVQFAKDIQDFNNFAKNYKNDYLSLSNDILNSNTLIGNKAKTLFDKYNLLDDCNYDYMTQNEKDICKNKMVRRVQEVATYQTYSDNLTKVHDNLSNLSYKLTTSNDIKESTDIGNAIAVQVAQLDLTKTQLQLMNEQNKRIDYIEQKHQEELIKQTRGKSADYSKFQTSIWDK